MSAEVSALSEAVESLNAANFTPEDLLMIEASAASLIAAPVLDDETAQRIEAAVRGALQPLMLYDAVSDTKRPVTQDDVDRWQKIERAFSYLIGATRTTEAFLSGAGKLGSVLHG